MPEQAQHILDFFKEAMCVDGEVRFATPEENEDALLRSKLQWIRFEDSKRGVFYLAVSK